MKISKNDVKFTSFVIAASIPVGLISINIDTQYVKILISITFSLALVTIIKKHYKTGNASSFLIFIFTALIMFFGTQPLP